MNIYLMAAIGGLVPELLRIIKGKYEPGFPDYFKHLKFWLAVIFQVLLGILLVYLFDSSDLKVFNTLDAFLFGFAAPEIITRLAAKQPEVDIRKNGQKFTDVDIRNFW